MKPHVHAELIKAWADGAEIEYLYDGKEWRYSSSPSWDRGLAYRIKDPYRELKEAAADPTKQIRLKGRDWYGDWYGVGEYALQPWSFNYPLECYEIRDKPKEKIKMWQWIYKQGDRFLLTREFFGEEPCLANPREAYRSQVISRADWTMIEVEE